MPDDSDSSPTSSSTTASPLSEADQLSQVSQQLKHRSKYHPNKGEASHHHFHHQLEEELRITRERLFRAENSLANKKWSPPYQLQLWLQLTYELELANCTAKRQAAEAQLIAAKDGVSTI